MTNTQGFTPAPFPQLQQPREDRTDPEGGIPGRNPRSEPAKKGKRRGPRPPKAAKTKPARKPKLKAHVKLNKAYKETSDAIKANLYGNKGKKPRKPRALKVDLALAMSALSGLSEDDAKVVHSFVQALAPFSKKARERICGALVKVIA